MQIFHVIWVASLCINFENLHTLKTRTSIQVPTEEGWTVIQIFGNVARSTRRFRPLVGDQRGVTGIETAIIMIAFVVVASVFAFTTLSTGIFSAERGKETIEAGLSQARSSIQIKGSVIANGVSDLTLSTGDDAWTGVTSTTAIADLTDKKEGSGSADIAMDVGFTTGLAAYDDLSAAVDLSGTDSIQLWVKSDVATNAGDIQLLVDDTAGCGSNLELVAIPALPANGWKLVNVAITDNSDMTAILCVGLRVNFDNGAQVVNLDKIIGLGQATNVIITLTNALIGEPIDLSEPSDSDADGFSDEDSIHTLIITYTDKDQVVRDMYWTQDFIGRSNSDHLLESGEKVEITVSLEGLANATPLVADKEFDIELRPQAGGVVVIERSMPDHIDTVNNLN